MENEVIRLHNMEGISRLSGTDSNGCTWIEFEVDSFAEQVPGECCICGEELWSGWMCLDGGDEVCDEHIQITEGEEVSDLEEFREYAMRSWDEVYDNNPAYQFSSMNKDGCVYMYYERPVNDDPISPNRWHSWQWRNIGGFFQNYENVDWKQMIVELNK